MLGAEQDPTVLNFLPEAGGARVGDGGIARAGAPHLKCPEAVPLSADQEGCAPGGSPTALEVPRDRLI